MQGEERMTEHSYKGQKIEIHTERIGARWDWWFVLNDRPPRHNAEQYASSEEAARSEALATAQHMIDGG
jgi:hypothetical protein